MMKTGFQFIIIAHVLNSGYFDALSQTTEALDVQQQVQVLKAYIYQVFKDLKDTARNIMSRIQNVAKSLFDDLKNSSEFNDYLSSLANQTEAQLSRLKVSGKVPEAAGKILGHRF
ncbi:hypothetical protein CSKR_113191 [Clonorchis sinensis]|uniref:Uncharacterized protein n=1 Tax=Clonorchis sinensis TaxID=79923 RepID=A0A8T1M0A6_CLOSI|nr:hypothetical protein CSKR_113191 [Clonorchis sinensis]